MRIVIDLQSCQSGSKWGGIGRYSMELAKAMASESRGHEVWLALNALMPDAIAEIRVAFEDLIPNERIQVFDLPSNLHIRTAEPTRVRAAEIIREDFLQCLQPDFVHIMSMFEGFDEDVVTSVGQYFPGSKTSVTLHDLIPLVQSARYLPNGKSQDYYERKIQNIKNAQLLLANSEFSRREGIDLLDLPPDRVLNVSAAADERFKPTTLDPQRATRLLARYGIQRKFLMFTASFDSRKNQANLISAFALLPFELREDYQLVLMGGGEEEALRKLRALVKKLGLHEGEVIFPGHVLDIDLVALYNLCHLFVLPSLAEGFGLPALEAMSCGAATIGSNLTSVPEVIGWTEALFDPTSPELIAKKIHQALTEPGFLRALRDHGLSQAKKFSWKQTADRAFDAFEAQHARNAENNGYDSRQSNLKSKSAAHQPRVFLAPENVSGVVGKILDLDGAANLSNDDILEISASIATNRSAVKARFVKEYAVVNM
jgi:glycosyltransferase involved in cell wall biosynthesis